MMPRDLHALLFPDNFDVVVAPRLAAPPPAPEPEPEPEPVPVKPPITEADLAAAQECGYLRGRADAAADEAAMLNATLATIAAKLDLAAEQAADIADRSALGLGRLILDVVLAACPALRERFGEPDIAAFVRIVLPGLAREPLVTISVHPSMVAGLQGFRASHPGPLDIVAQPDLPPGDAIVTWTDGRALHQSDEICRKITGVLMAENLLPAAAGHATHPKGLTYAG